MASTYSSNLRLELITTGEQQGTWGSTTNTNLGTLLEQAITGYTAVSVTDGADTTLSTANGASDQARNMTLNLTGALTATRNVICPGTPKIYIVKNSTTGGFAVTFKVTGQTGVSIPNGATYLLFVDGTDARQATGSVASGGTGTSTSTGTGSVVLSASPTFTGVPAAPSAAADTNTTQIATTAYVVGQASASTPVVDGTATIGTSLRYARADHIHPTDTSRAAVASPTFTGTPAAPTAAVDTNTTQLATTAYVINQGYLKSATASATYAPLSSPGLTGVPTAPTAGGGTNNTQIATTAFVQTAVASSSSTGRLLRAPQVLSSAGSGTYTTPSGCTAIYVEVVGGGGGGGGTGNNSGACGGGGASGAYAAKYFSVTANTGYSYTVGAAGVGQNNLGGTAGGASTFTVGGTTVSGSGGGGGSRGTATTGSAQGGNANLSTGGDLNGTGNRGGTAYGNPGDGAPSFFGSGFGGGGDGAGPASSLTLTGSAGTSGLIRIWEYS